MNEILTQNKIDKKTWFQTFNGNQVQKLMTTPLILRNIFELFNLHIKHCQNLKDNIFLLNKLAYLQSKFTKTNYFLDDIKNFTEKKNL